MYALSNPLPLMKDYQKHKHPAVTHTLEVDRKPCSSEADSRNLHRDLCFSACVRSSPE